jgi:hypothetical protein
MQGQKNWKRDEATLKVLKVDFKNTERSTRKFMEQSVCLVNIIKTHSTPQYSYTTVL